MNLNEKRYEVIAPMPGYKFKVGDILYKHSHLVFGNTYEWYGTDRFSQAINACDIDKYPHLFKELTWNEHRDMSDMPDYMFNCDENAILKVDKSNSSSTHFKVENGALLLWSPRRPATLADYEQFKKNEQ